MLYVDEELVKDVLPGVTAWPAFPQISIHDSDLAFRLLSLCRSLEFGDPCLAVETNLLSYLRCMFLKHAHSCVGMQIGTGTEPRHVALIQEYLRANLCRNVALSELARITGLSKAYVIRSFRRIVGMPPYEWLLQLRVEQARKSLQRGHPISDVAMELGFADQSHFHRCFKRLTGMTPANYAAGHYRSRQENAATQ